MVKAQAGEAYMAREAHGDGEVVGIAEVASVILEAVEVSSTDEVEAGEVKGAAEIPHSEPTNLGVLEATQAIRSGGAVEVPCSESLEPKV
ncbi:hypothetical protein Nepgr_026262 [Nepenthes gracilis]|uniref:Uncharacterized protein n=1 Tax=Nepenthes gracilis TaxID=150966 RepID=A0AAD3Y1W9_NEPGR|nr:hypothetical protein Nepgr_026262 [Nepenthes gracilis]